MQSKSAVEKGESLANKKTFSDELDENNISRKKIKLTDEKDEIKNDLTNALQDYNIGRYICRVNP